MSDNRNFDLLGDNIIPFSAEAEQSILGSVLSAPESMDKLSGSIKTEHFYIHQHQEIAPAQIQKSLPDDIQQNCASGVK